MRKDTITLFSRVELPATSGPAADPAGAHLASILNTEVAGLGYALERGLAGAFAALPRAEFDAQRGALLDALIEIKGASRRHATLYKGFPYEREDSLDYMRNWVLGIVGRDHDLPPLQLRIALDGTIINLARVPEHDREKALELNEGEEWIPFVMNALGGEGDGLTEDGEERIRHAFASVTPLKPLMLADPGFVARKAGALMLRNASLSEAEKAWLRTVPPEAAHAAVDALVAHGRAFRETLPIAYVMARDPGQVAPLLVGATDVLRIATALSDPEADLSLKDPVKFKLSTARAKGVLRLLEGLAAKGQGDGLAEDLLRHRERWLRLGELVHPGSAKNRARFPGVAAAFDALRRSPALIQSHNRVVEAATRVGRVDAPLIERMASRPGDMMRRLDVLLRTARDPSVVIDGVRSVVGAVPTKMLFEMEKYLSHRALGGTPDRVFVPKGRTNRMQIVPDTRAAIPADVLEEARDVLRDEIARRCAALEPMGRVYLDPALREVVMPYNRRGDSATSTPVSKGSRFPVGDSDVMRLFVHWTGNDVDLSLLMLAENLEVIDRVSWTQTQTWGCKHSGDVVHAPNGASEFIDMTLPRLAERGVRYAVMSLISYSGGNFSGFPCFAGFMERDSLTSGKLFEPASVALKFEVGGEGTSSMPLMIDVLERKAIYADILSGGRDYGTVTGSANKLQAQVRAMLDLPRTKPTAWDVLHAHAAARGTLVSRMDEADVAYMATTLDMEALQSLVAMPAPGRDHQPGAASSVPRR